MNVRHGIGAALVVVGAVLALGSALLERAQPARALGGERPVNDGAGDRGDITANNSPSITRNPRDPDNLVVANRIDSPDFACAVHASFDGGRRWSRTRVPVPEGRTCYAPDAAFAPDGTLHVAYVTLEGPANTPRAAWVASSRDGGRTLSAPAKVTGPRAFQVRIATGAGALYVTWVQARDVGNLRFAGPGNPINVARSGDGGRTWSRPVRVNDPQRGRVLAPSPAIGADGELYVLFLDVGDDRLDYEGAHEGLAGPPHPGRFSLVLGRSLDGGASWEESLVDDGLVPIGRFIPFLPPFPSLAVDRDGGRIYAAFHDARSGSADVWVWSLAPGDDEWRDPVRVNDTPQRDGTSQYLPQLAVAAGGRLDIVYYDRRKDPRDVRTGVSLQSSHDGGKTFGRHLQLSSRSFDSRVGFGSERGLPDLGSRLGLVAADDDTLAVWSDTRAGTAASGKQDLMSASVMPARPGVDATTADDIGRAGLAVMLGGFAALLLARKAQR